MRPLRGLLRLCHVNGYMMHGADGRTLDKGAEAEADRERTMGPGGDILHFGVWRP